MLLTSQSTPLGSRQPWQRTADQQTGLVWRPAVHRPGEETSPFPAGWLSGHEGSISGVMTFLSEDGACPQMWLEQEPRAGRVKIFLEFQFYSYQFDKQQGPTV